MKAAPDDPHTTAVTLYNYSDQPRSTGGVVIYDDGVERPVGLPGWGQQAVPASYDVLAWGDTDSILASADNEDVGLQPVYSLSVSSSGVSYLSQTPAFNNQYNEIHSDFGTGLIYSDDGNVANPSTGAIVGSYNASGLVAPDSTLNRVFILGQTAAQSGTNGYTIQSFDEKAYTPIASITLPNLVGSPIALVRSGTSGLAVLTNGGEPSIQSSSGMLYLVQDSTLVSSARPSSSAQAAQSERVQHRWKQLSKKDLMKLAQHRGPVQQACCAVSEAPEQ
jgi:hypothetical protein